jgi:hypothetical protein
MILPPSSLKPPQQKPDPAQNLRYSGRRRAGGGNQKRIDFIMSTNIMKRQRPIRIITHSTMPPCFCVRSACTNAETLLHVRSLHARLLGSFSLMRKTLLHSYGTLSGWVLSTRIDPLTSLHVWNLIQGF